MYEQKLRSINTNQLRDRLNRKDKPHLLIDVREVEAFDKGHIPGAISLFDPEIMSLAKDMDKNMDIIVYATGTPTHTKMCDDAARRFMDMKFKNVWSFEEGLEGWINAGNRVDRSERRMT
ncbi:rhodanese-like domain-containing protein [Methanocella sp. CWC-04]|uniref:Rhodanese-like domain-containing protein n=1 Tax=Methanooceanicella nereidis TaxID=2052831 RepID=A0AAP2RDH5_9EURY|nr:rhodanese-like domain-containing protein [Methanocella sp. CWC-04]MCD1294786.1 rhodanese-like domain-containing protein [Methanocella sp. CWC-04]